MPRWQKLLAVAYVMALAALVVVFRSRIGPDFWPLDASRVGPNIVAAVLTVLVMTPVGVLLWPPTRRRLHRFIDSKLAPIHEHLARQREHNAWMAAHLASLYEHHTGEPPAPHPYLESQTAPTSKEKP